MVTAGCCILCLSVRKPVADYMKKKFFDMIVRHYARKL